MSTHHIGFTLSDDKTLDTKVLNALNSRNRYESKVNYIKKAIVFYSQYNSAEISGGGDISVGNSFGEVINGMNEMLKWMKEHIKDAEVSSPESDIKAEKKQKTDRNSKAKQSRRTSNETVKSEAEPVEKILTSDKTDDRNKFRLQPPDEPLETGKEDVISENWENASVDDDFLGDWAEED